MLKEIVEVLEAFDNKVKVRFERKEACSGCSALFLCQPKEGSVIIDNPGFPLRKGDRVEVGIEENKTLFASCIAFLVPTAIFVSSLILFRNKQEVVSFFLAIFFVVVYYLIVKVIVKNKGKYFHVRTLRKL